MRYVLDSPLQLGHKVWQLRPPQPSLTVVVKGTFDVVEGADAALADPQVPTTGELFFDDDPERSQRMPSDFALLKPCGECFVVGRAWAPGGRPAPAVMCRFKVGPIEKRFAVFGDRAWEGAMGSFSAPQPFVSMPLAMDLAFGGAGYKPNPWGKGRDTVDGVRALPNLERPDALISSASSKPEPVVLGPLPVPWPGRQRYAGTYDAAYLRDRWPWLPADFDWRFFLEAPEDQRLRSGHWRGDEAIEIEGLHPTQPSLRGHLPRIAPRVFLDLREGAAPPRFVEVALALDTVTWDGEQGKLLLTWRGSNEVASEALAELSHVYLTHEPLGGPHATADELQARCQALLDAEDAEEEEAEGDEPPAPDEPEPPEVQPPPTPEELEIEAQIDAMGEKVAQMTAAGEPERPDPKDTLAKMKEAGVEVSPELEAMLNEDFTVQAPAPDEPPDSPPALEGRALLEARIAAKESVQELDLTGVDLSGMDLSGLDLAGSIFARANLTEANLSSAVLLGVNLQGAMLFRANLASAILAEADLTTANLTWADLHEANLTDAVLDGATLQGARLAKVVAPRATFLAANLTEALLTEGDFLEADFERARLDRADLTAARLQAATLEDASAEAARFDRALMTQVRAEGLRAPKAQLGAVDAEDSFWERAELSEATFAFARLTRADFSEAVLIGTNLDGTSARQARFDRANAHSLTARKADLMEASFESADLTLADLGAANLFGAQLWRAKLDHARLELADLTRTLREPR